MFVEIHIADVVLSIELYELQTLVFPDPNWVLLSLEQWTFAIEIVIVRTDGRLNRGQFCCEALLL